MEIPAQIPIVNKDPNEIIIRAEAPDPEREKALRQRMDRGDVGSAAALALLILKRNPKILDKELFNE